VLSFLIFSEKMTEKMTDQPLLRRTVRGILVALMILWGVVPPLQGAEVKRVAVFPFVLHAQERMDYVREGVQDMLTSRLFWEDRVVIIEGALIKKVLEKDPGPLDEGRVQALGKQLGAHVALWGSINVLGATVSIDINVLQFSSRQPVRKFYAQAKTMDEVIPRVNELADMINEKVFDRPRETAPASSGVPAVASTPTSKTDGGAEASKAPVSLKGLTINPLSPQIILNAGGFEMAGVWRSAILPFALVDLDFGDLDGDGTTETVLISKNAVYIYRFLKDRFERVKEIRGALGDHYLSVDVADIQGTGKPQIFVTNYRDNTLRSFSVAWVQGEYKVVTRNIPYYLRVHRLPGKGTVLLGQQKYGDRFFDDRIFILAWKEGRYVPTERLHLPDGLTVYDFVLLEEGRDGSQEIMHINRFNRLVIASEKGKAKYSSAENYGGTINALRNAEPEGLATVKDEEKQTYYLPARLVVLPSKNPGEKEFILNRNKGSFFNFLARYKAFVNGEIYALGWDGTALREKWRTPVIADYIANYNVGGFKNNGQDQLVVGVVQSTGPIPFITDARSLLYVYELGEVKTTRK
jgi:hypothetical protein